MVDKKQVIKEKVDYQGVFNFKDFYKYAHQFFKNENYDAVIEEKYEEKLASPDERNIKIEWNAQKSISDYFKIRIDAKFEITNMINVEVEIDGKRKKMNKGGISVDIKGTLIRDPESKWEVTPFYKFIREIYDKYIIPTRIAQQEEKVSSDVIAFKEHLKSFLEIYGKRD